MKYRLSPRDFLLFFNIPLFGKRAFNLLAAVNPKQGILLDRRRGSHFAHQPSPNLSTAHDCRYPWRGLMMVGVHSQMPCLGFTAWRRLNVLLRMTSILNRLPETTEAVSNLSLIPFSGWRHPFVKTYF